MDEEQEREVAAEAEREQQVQRPPKARPKKHENHEDMKKLVSTGVIAEGSTTFLPAFRSLDKTSAARHPGVDQFPVKLLVTRDYAQTVEPIDIFNSTDHKPTVNHMVIIRPYEAQELYPSIKDSKHVTLHLYAPRSNLGLKPLDKLVLYNVSGEVTSALCMPRSFIIELNLFAGKLYLSSYEELWKSAIFWRGMEANGRG
ncbi:hypothetical protein BDV34DRAFT_227833 [Aspergillus parasiticus]|uniref:Uncharacterized protein n=1 Tax=Aspergillus parasiticus TaxID=5067 RepID=A0A5N6DCU0_ASPPA|nr:hypothetical protein BDV34DRAFT_227833 [Aspergillus parasiticus]